MDDPTRIRPIGTLAALLLGWSTLSVVVHSAAAPFLVGHLGGTVEQLAVRGALWALLGVLISGAMAAPFRALFRDPTPTALRLLGLIGLAAVGGLVFSAIFEATHWPLPELPRRRATWARALAPTLSLLSFGALQLVTWNVQRLQHARERALRAEALAVEARLAMLRYELDPHFLFNTLNSVIGTIDESPPRAQRMVRQLGELLRHTLNGAERHVPLAEELRTLELYLAIEQVRFEDRLEVRFEVEPEARERLVPPMLLQPLVENAIKHGMRGEGPLRVRVEARASPSLELVVANTGRIGEPGAGIGLRNLRDRLAHAYDGRARFTLAEEGDEVVARLVLPEAA